MKKTWTHKRYGKKQKFEGFYKIKGKAKRIFILKPIDNDLIQHQVFNSPSAARKLGWV